MSVPVTGNETELNTCSKHSAICWCVCV